jgi:hypothetical protein
MNKDELSHGADSLLIALNLQQDALEKICLILTAACELDDGPAISDDEAIVLKAKHRDVLWKACVAALQVCRNTPRKVLHVLQPREAIIYMTEHRR